MNQTRISYRNACGLTLIEVLATVTILAIIITFVLLFVTTSIMNNLKDRNLSLAQNYAQIIMDFTRNQELTGTSSSIHVGDVDISNLDIKTNTSPGPNDWKPIATGSSFSYYVTTGSNYFGPSVPGQVQILVEIQYPVYNSKSIYSLATKVRLPL